MEIKVRKPAIGNISTKICVYIAVYMVFLKPAIIEDIYYLDLIFNALRFGLSIFFFFKILIGQIGKRKGPILYYASIFITVLLSTLIHSGDMNRVLANFVPAIGMMSWLYLNRNDYHRIINFFYSTGLSFLVINLLTVILFPDGMWKRDIYISVWLLGQKQDFYTCIVATVFCGLFAVAERKKKRGSLAFAFIVMISTAVLTKAIGTLLCIFAIIALLWFESFKNKIFGVRTLAIVNTIGFAASVFFAYFYSFFLKLQGFLAGLTSTGMGKDATFMIRTQMWEYAINMFIKNPLIGIGRVTEDMWYRTSGLSYYHTIVHNFYFDILMTGGGCVLLLPCS